MADAGQTCKDFIMCYSELKPAHSIQVLSILGFHQSSRDHPGAQASGGPQALDSVTVALCTI